MLAGFSVLAIVFILFGVYLREIQSPEWLQMDTTQHPAALRPWPVEADCYSQLARVQRILRGQGLIQNHFQVENWPEGLVPSTTAPFDYVILLLYAPMRLFTKFPLDWAGALVSPLLWLALVAFWLLCRSRTLTRTGRLLLIIGSATLPPLIWATACGRPRHQSLILFLLAMAFTAEYERWHLDLIPRRAWHIFAGVVWGLACWTSLFEPALLVTLVIVFNLIARRRESPAFLISFGTVVVVALLVEGIHVFNIFSLSPEYSNALVRWLGTIAEMRGTDFSDFIHPMTLGVLALPFVAWRLLARDGDRCADLLLILITTLLIILTAYQRRWIYYASLGELFLIVRYCQSDPLRWTRLAVLLFFLTGLGVADVQLIHDVAQGVPANQPSLELLEISRAIDQPGGVMAPWWLSPGLLYFSGQPIVSGSSHCGISGIVDSAKFYTATSWIDAERILQKRKVRWVVVMDDRAFVYPVLNVERSILGLPDYTEDSKTDADSTVWQILITGELVPRFLQLHAISPSFKLYEYVPVGEK